MPVVAVRSAFSPLLTTIVARGAPIRRIARLLNAGWAVPVVAVRRALLLGSAILSSLRWGIGLWDAWGTVPMVPMRSAFSLAVTRIVARGASIRRVARLRNARWAVPVISVGGALSLALTTVIPRWRRARGIAGLGDARRTVPVVAMGRTLALAVITSVVFFRRA